MSFCYSNCYIFLNILSGYEHTYSQSSQQKRREEYTQEK